MMTGATLHHGDCLAHLAGMAAKSVDSVLTDPPYEKHMHAKRDGARWIRNDGGFLARTLDFDDVEAIRPLVAPHLVRVCRGWLVIFCTPEGIAPWRDALEAACARYKRACFWIKPDAAPQFNGQGPAMAVEAFVTAWCGQGVSKWNGGGRRNFFTHATNPPDRDGFHPTEKPLALMREIVALFTQPADMVLDPFAGSGTTGLACLHEGRAFVGIEAKQDYFDVMQRRIAGFGRSPLEARAIRRKGLTDHALPLFIADGGAA